MLHLRSLKEPMLFSIWKLMVRWYFQWVYSLMQTGGSPVHVLSDRQLTALFP